MPAKRKRGTVDDKSAVRAEGNISRLLVEWKTIASDKNRSLELINAMVDAGPSSIPENAYELVWVTHMIHRMTREKIGEKSSPHEAQALAYLCYYVATALLVDKLKLEKVSSKALRSIIARALVSVAMGAMKALPLVTGNALWACVTALELVTQTKSDGWNSAQDAITAYIDLKPVDDEDILDVGISIALTPDEQACHDALMRSSQSIPKKRQARGNDPEDSNLSVVFAKITMKVLEGRVILRRISSVILLWFCNGQECILKKCSSVIQLDMDDIPIQKSKGSNSKDRRRPVFPTIPSNVAKVAVVCRLLNIAAELVSSGGLRAPTGGIEPFVQGYSASKKVKPMKVRSLLALVLYSLIQIHENCLESITDLGLVNDEDFIKNDVSIYPFVHKTLDVSCRSEISFAPAFLSVVSCNILQSKCIRDAKLCAFAIGQCHTVSSFLLEAREEDSSPDLVDLYKSLDPLPKLTVSSTKSRKKDDSSAYLKLLETKSSDLMILYFRALQSPSSLIVLLLDVLEKCYQTSTAQSADLISGGSSKVKAGKKKQIVLPITSMRRLSATRAGLASDICTVLRCFVTLHHPLQTFFRSFLTVDHICRFVRLSYLLESILTATKSDSKNRDPATLFFQPNSSDYNLYERTLWTSHTNLCYTLGRGRLLHSNTIHENVLLGSSKLQIYKEIIHSCGTKDWPLHLPASLHALVTSNLTCEPIMPEEVEAEDYLVTSFLRSVSDALSDPLSVTYTQWLGHSDLDLPVEERPPLSFRDARLFLVAHSRLVHGTQMRNISKFAEILNSSLSAFQSDDILKEVLSQNGEVSQFLARTLIVYTNLLNMVTADLQESLFENTGPYQYSLPRLYSLRSILDGETSKTGNWHKKESCFMGLFGDWESTALPAVSITHSLPQDLILMTNEILEKAFVLGFICAPKDRGQLLIATWNSLGRRLTWDPDCLMRSTSSRKLDELSWPAMMIQLRDDICKTYFQLSRNTITTMPDTLLGRVLKNIKFDLDIPLDQKLREMLIKANRTVDIILEISSSGRNLEPIEFTLLEALSVYVAFIASMHTSCKDMFSRRENIRKNVKRGGKSKALPASGSCFDIELLASLMSDEESGESDIDFTSRDEILSDQDADIMSHLHEACKNFGAAPMHPDWLDTSCSFQEGIHSQIAMQNAMLAINCLSKIGILARERYCLALKNSVAVLGGISVEDPKSDVLANGCCQVIDNSAFSNSRDAVKNDNEYLVAIASSLDFPLDVVEDFCNNAASTAWKAAKEAWIINCPQLIVGPIHNQCIDIMETCNSEYRAVAEWEMLFCGTLVTACTGFGTNDPKNLPWKSANDTPNSNHKTQISNARVYEERWYRVAHGVISNLMPVVALLRFSMAGSGREPHPLSLSTGSKTFDWKLLKLSFGEKEHPSMPLPDQDQSSLLECFRFIAQMFSCNKGNEDLQRSCFAVASNLLMDAEVIKDIEGMELIRSTLKTLGTIEGMASINEEENSNRNLSIQYVIKALVAILQSKGKGTSQVFSKVHNKDSKYSRIYDLVCGKEYLEASVIGLGPVPKAKIFESENTVRENSIRSLIFILCGRDTIVDSSIRSSVVDILVDITNIESRISAEHSSSIRQAVLGVFSMLDSSQFEKLMDLIFPVGSISTLPTGDAIKGVCVLLAASLCEDDRTVSLNFCEKVYVMLKERIFGCLAYPIFKEYSAGILFLFACRTGTLHSLGTELMNRLKDEGQIDADLFMLQSYLIFVNQLRTSQNNFPLVSQKTGLMNDLFKKQTILAGNTRCAKKKNPRACSHALRNGFFHQHWYNCFTCGLILDKGCCSICALVCHKGHDVAYSRSSSFFCDCGAEAGSVQIQDRVGCLCLTPMSEEEANRLFEEEKEKKRFLVGQEASSPTSSETRDNHPQIVFNADLFVEAALTLREKAATAIDSIKEAAVRDSWISTILAFIERHPHSSTMESLPKDIDMDAPLQSLNPVFVVNKLQRRSGVQLDLKRNENNQFNPIRAIRSGSFNVKLSLDTTIDRLKRKSLGKHPFTRSAIVSDSRGRQIIAEQRSLTLCTLFPIINSNFIDDAIKSPVGRSMINVTASHDICFNVVGIQICRENERHLLVWGVSEACIVILKRSWDGVEKSIALDLDLDIHENEANFVLKCDWIPDSQTHFSVTCGTFIKVFNVLSYNSEELLCAILTYSVAYEALVKDTAWVPQPSQSKIRKAKMEKKNILLFLLMDTGRLHKVQVQVNRQGVIETQGVFHLESSSPCIDIPTDGIRPYVGVTPGHSGSSTKSMGEGCNLHYLFQSNILLYQCASSCVVALTFDDSGSIVGSFEILPNRIEGDILGYANDAFSIVGPFTSWTEGTAVSGSMQLFCFGKSYRTNLPKLLSILVNETTVKIQEIIWPACDAVALGLSLNVTFDGLSAFSAPKLLPDERVIECLYVSVLTSHGSLLIYGEDFETCAQETVQTASEAKNKMEMSTTVPYPTFALTVFEDLLNVTDAEELCFSLNDRNCTSDQLKEKLSPKSSTYLMSPSNDGCTITIALKGPVTKMKSEVIEVSELSERIHGSHSKDSRKEDLIVAALRILVGSSHSECLPSCVYIQGRPVNLKMDAKRWYDLPLTWDEVLKAVRNGFVSLGIGPVNEKDNFPVLDAVEVYAISRSKVQHLIPQTLGNFISNRSKVNESVPRSVAISNTLSQIAHILSYVYGLVGVCQTKNSSACDSFEPLIRYSLQSGDKGAQESMMKLLEQVESDSNERQKFLDDVTISVVSEEVQHILHKIGNFKLCKFEGEIERLNPGLSSVSSIVIFRPENYIKALQRQLESHTSIRSIGCVACDIILLSIEVGIPCCDMLENVIQLILSELTIGEQSAPTFRLATFDSILMILKSDNQYVIEVCCEAIKKFMNKHSSVPMKNDFFQATDIENSAPIAYQCDSCSKFPITEERYTLLEDENDIDLCSKCYKIGWEYAEKVDFCISTSVIINERSIGGDTKLSCGNIQQMQSVPIMNGTAIVEQVAKFSGIRTKDPKLQLLRASQLEAKISRGKGKINIEAFTDDLFENILSLVENILDGTVSEIPTVRLNPILSLLLDSVNLGSSDKSRISRAKRYVQAVFKFVKRMLDSISVLSSLEKSRQILLVNFLNSLCWLTGIRPEGNPSTGDDASEASPATLEKCKRKTDPRYSCDIHGVPAVRRRCSSGANKDRRFYVCGMDRKQRCNYFKWADQSIRMGNPARNIAEKEIDSFIWKVLIDSSSPHPSLSDQICDLVGAEIFKRDGRHNIESQFSDMKSSSALALHRKKNIFFSFYSQTDVMVDFRDGVYRSREKFNRYCGNPKSESDESVESHEIFLSHNDSDEYFLSDKYLEASMNLISAVASPSSSKDFKVPGQQRWYSLLSKVICLNTASRLRPQATLALKRMCLGDRALYHSVRDHYVFGFQVMEIFQNSKGILRGALCVREQARQCGDNWKDKCTDFSNLDAGALLGTIDLIQEDCISLHVASRIGIVLDDLLRDARSRVLNWRNFCSKVSFEFDADIELGTCRVASKGNNDWMDNIFCGPPIFTLFWLSCSFSGPNQVKVMALIDLALTSKEESKYLLTLSSIESVDPIGSSDILGGDSLEGGVSDSTDIDKDDEQLSFHSGPLQRPEEILLNDSKAISLHDIFSFASQFVLKGRTVELRKVSSRVVIGLCRNLDSEKRMHFIEFLVDKVVAEIDNLGCASIQSMQLLQTLFKIGDGMKSQDLDSIGRKIAEGFTKQMHILHWIRETEFSCLEPERILPSKFDTTKCAHCHRLHNFFSGKGGQKKASSQLQAKKNSRDLQNEIEKSGNLISKCQIPWAYEQVRPFIKLRLESSIENTCSSAFSLYAQLKCRLSISEVHLTISDPRARFVKSIVIYATPRQVSKVNDLKSRDYDHIWQKCAVITLARGAKKGACSLPVAVTAANIKIEYCEFYDRSQGNKNDDGSFVLFCPRCSRQVNNAHGVCGSCGECVFQCRRCRQIHYDSPDAFLCAECGHCSSGTFSYHLTAGVASNAVAIVDDESCIRTIKILSQAKKLYEDLLSALTERVRECFRKRELSGIDPLTEYGPAMKRALMGDMPKIDYIGKSSKIQKMNNNSDNNGDANAPSSAANRARSLLRLARQLRGEGDQANRNRESLVREAFLAGSEFQLDELDDDGVDMFSLWGSGDRSNALNRLIATFANPRTDLRLKERAKLNSQTAMGNNLHTKMAIKDDSSKGVIQECEKLYQLTREAERECYELQRRLDAWRNLEKDCLKEIAMKSPNNVIRATKCMRCSGNVTLHLLLLLLRLVQSNSIKDFQKILGKEFVQALLMEPSQLSKELFNLKRLAVTTLCIKSDHASLLILDELRIRLKASNDRAAATMLGKLLEIEFPLSDQFFALATETLEANVT